MKDNPGVLAPPPLIFAVVFAAGAGLDNLFHVAVPPIAEGWREGLALLLAAAGGALGLGAVLAFRRAGTNVLPEQPTLAITRRGPYQFTRNPMYLGLALLYAAAAIGLVLPITLGLLPIALVVLHIGVVVREERYLERKFGDVYVSYRRTVRRWL